MEQWRRVGMKLKTENAQKTAAGNVFVEETDIFVCANGAGVIFCVLPVSHGYRQVLWGSTRSGNPQRNCVLIFVLSHTTAQWCSGCVTPFSISSITSAAQELGLFDVMCKARLGQGGQLWSSIHPHHPESSRCRLDVVWLQIQTWESEDLPW